MKIEWLAKKVGSLNEETRKYLVRLAAWLIAYVFTITAVALAAVVVVHFSR